MTDGEGRKLTCHILRPRYCKQEVDWSDEPLLCHPPFPLFLKFLPSSFSTTSLMRVMAIVSPNCPPTQLNCVSQLHKAVFPLPFFIPCSSLFFSPLVLTQIQSLSSSSQSPPLLSFSFLSSPLSFPPCLHLIKVALPG